MPFGIVLVRTRTKYDEMKYFRVRIHTHTSCEAGGQRQISAHLSNIDACTKNRVTSGPFQTVYFRFDERIIIIIILCDCC